MEMTQNYDFLKNIKLVCLDMDGTIYKAGRLFDCTLPFLDFLRRNDIKYLFLSNNSSFSTDMYVQKLRKMGIDAAADDFYISTHYTIDYIKRKMPHVKNIYLLAIPEVAAEFEAAGFNLTDKDVDAFVLAFDKTLTYEKICKGAFFLRSGVPSIATHPDVFCPCAPDEWLVDCGAFISMLETSTDKKMTVLGKPDPGILRHAALRYGITNMEQVMMIGDRLSTDISVGVNANAHSCHINAEVNEFSKETVIPDMAVHDLGILHDIWANITEQK